MNEEGLKMDFLVYTLSPRLDELSKWEKVEGGEELSDRLYSQLVNHEQRLFSISEELSSNEVRIKLTHVVNVPVWIELGQRLRMHVNSQIYDQQP